MAKKRIEPEDMPFTDTMLNNMRPMRDVFPDLVEYSLRRKRGRPPKAACKEKLTVRLDADIVEWLQKKGRGYQTRLNAILRDAMEDK